MKKKLRIAFFSHNSGCYGAERSLLELIGGVLKKRYAEPYLIVPAEGELAEEARKAGIPVHVAGYCQPQWVSTEENRFKPLSVYRRDLIRTMKMVEDKLVPRLRELGIDAVYTQTLVIPWGAYCAARLEIPHVLGVREYGVADHAFRFLAGYENSLNALVADSVLSCFITQDVKREILSRCSREPAGRTFVAGSSVSVPAMWTSHCCPLFLPRSPQQPFRIYLPGRIRETKGQLYAVEAAAILKRSGIPVLLELQGGAEKPYRRRIEQRIRTLHLEEQVKLLPQAKNVFPQIAQCDVLLSASRCEALGRTLLEAALMNVPILFADSGGPAGVFRNAEDCLAFQPDSAEDLAEKLKTVLSDPERTRRRTEEYRRLVEREFHDGRYIDGQWRLIQECCSAESAICPGRTAALLQEIRLSAGERVIAECYGILRWGKHLLASPVKRRLKKGTLLPLLVTIPVLFLTGRREKAVEAAMELKDRSFYLSQKRNNPHPVSRLMYRMIARAGQMAKRILPVEAWSNRETGQEKVLPYDSHYEENIDFSGYESEVKLIAFYLPQFHTFPENDLWWGKGFTEWTNTRRAVPLFPGHYQPRIPHKDIGYYDLSDWRVIQTQAKLARDHGISGFCFYYYWFSGKRLMEKPLDLFLAHPEIDIDFCCCWANENWTRTWDGKESSVLCAQKHERNDVDFIRDLSPCFRDSRYIRINGRPLVLVYRCDELPDPSETFRLWRQWAAGNGIGELEIWVVRGGAVTSHSVLVEGADAEVEFPPAYCTTLTSLNPEKFGCRAKGALLDYRAWVRRLIAGHGCVEHFSHRVFRSVMLGWDNSARRKSEFNIWYGFSLKAYYEYLTKIIADTRRRHPVNERYVFINAWNEWGEGSYLEPDEKYGYASLNTTARALFHLPYRDVSRIRCPENGSAVSELPPNGKPAAAFREEPERIAVILPVYNHPECLMRCVNSVLKNSDMDYTLYLIDDASTDPEISRCLSGLGRHPDVEVSVNRENLGFPKTVNSVLRRIAGRHVVLLNSDTEVPPGWLSRLIAPFYRFDRVRTATPFSNSATLCSFPAFMEDSPPLWNLSVDILDAAFAKIAFDRPLALPVGNGFCLAIHRDLLQEAGCLPELYGRGYGEENDLCATAAEHGWINTLVPNLFVRHNHSSSFSPEERLELCRSHERILYQRHPGLPQRLEQFCREDPYQGYRLRAMLNLIIAEAVTLELRTVDCADGIPTESSPGESAAGGAVLIAGTSRTEEAVCLTVAYRREYYTCRLTSAAVAEALFREVRIARPDALG